MANWTTAPARRRVIRDGVGIGIATGAYGLSFGALAVVAGLSIAQTCALSLLMFTGASQFAFVGVVASGGSVGAAAASAVLLGTRNALYGLHLSRILNVRGPRRAGVAHLVIDESAAMSFAGGIAGRSVARPPAPAGVADPGVGDPGVAHPGGRAADAVTELSRLGFYVAGGAVFVAWNLATALGAVGARALSDPGRYGLDAVAPAAFLALLAPRLKDRRSWTAALAAVVIAVATAPVLPAGVPVLLAALAVVLLGLRGPRGDRTGAAL